MMGFALGKGQGSEKKKEEGIPPTFCLSGAPLPGPLARKRVSLGAFSVHTPVLFQDSGFPIVRLEMRREKLRDLIALAVVL